MACVLHARLAADGLDPHDDIYREQEPLRIVCRFLSCALNYSSSSSSSSFSASNLNVPRGYDFTAGAAERFGGEGQTGFGFYKRDSCCKRLGRTE